VHTFTIGTCGKYEIAQLDGNELSDIHSYMISRMPDGTKLLTLQLVIGDFDLVSEEQK